MSDPLAAWDYTLPPGHIARHPAPRRHDARLMHVPLEGGALADHVFSELPGLLRPGDLVVANDTRVMPARLRATRATGGAVELLLLEPGPGPVRAMARPARKLKDGEVLALSGGHTATVRGAPGPDGTVAVELSGAPAEIMEAEGEMPLPPYLQRASTREDRERYQTIYAGPLGAAAAPTAGLHFTDEVLEALAARDVRFSTITLHVGIGTFRNLRPEDVERGRLHPEPYVIPDATADAIARTRQAGGRVVAIGTTTTRALEAATRQGARSPEPGPGTTDLFVQPPYRFRAIDGLVTNLHLPRSSLLLLVGALTGRERLLGAYEEAVRRGYRFYSYGDAMLLL